MASDPELDAVGFWCCSDPCENGGLCDSDDCGCESDCPCVTRSRVSEPALD